MRKAYIWVMLIVSAVVGVIVMMLNRVGFFTSGYDVIPHLIVVASIVMGMVTLTLTIMMAIKGGNAYILAKTRKPEILEQIYGFSSAALISGMFTIVLSIIIIMTKQYVMKYAFYKSCCVFMLTTAFVYMIITVSTSYWQSIQLLQIDDELKK